MDDTYTCTQTYMSPLPPLVSESTDSRCWGSGTLEVGSYSVLSQRGLLWPRRKWLVAQRGSQALSLLQLIPYFSSLGSLILKQAAGERASDGLMRPGISIERAACLLAAALEA